MNAAEPQFEGPSPSTFDGGGDDDWKAVSSGGARRGHRAGDVLAGRYRLLSPLGEGGMGSVWRARSLALEIDVAVKVVKRGTSSPHACERLLREARAAAALAHPSIVRVLDFGTTDAGEPFLVMQLLKGKSLGAWLDERGRLPAVTAVALLLPIAAALAEVHDLGFIHRDIKPENILIEDGPGGLYTPKLVDFGIAKHVDGDQAGFTQSGVLMGSPAYMSPEQARGQPDAQSDVWSLCVVLYELITGKRPFEGPNHGAVLFAVFADEPAPTHTQAAGDQALWEILQRGLAKAQSERWQSMRELGRALAEWAAAHDVVADAAGTSIAHRWLGRPSGRPPGAGQSTTRMAARPRSPEPTDPACRAHAVPSRPLSERDLTGGAHGRLPRMLVLGSAVAILVGVLTFRALAPTAPQAGTATSPAPPPASAADDAVTPDAPAEPAAAAGAPEVIPAPTASASAVSEAETREPARPTTAAPGPAPRRPSQARRPLPLPRHPDF